TTFFKIDQINNNDASSYPIGGPISNTQVYILDKEDRLSPCGIAGELCISGDGLARGYLNRPELTSEKFVENPFISGMRMYRTGDLARWLPDGNIEFLGRIDNQVKIRGFRIELGEIEKSLLQHGDITSAVVLAKEGTDGDKHLVAYYSSGNELEISELRVFLAESLPDYMIPSFFIHMETFPLTPNGKIDRKALPEPDGAINTGMEYVPPRNETEEILAGIWQEILGVDRIGVKDNFFDLGGHSLKATRVVSRISKDLEVEVSLKDIFSSPTIGSLAEIIKLSSKKEYFQIEAISVQDSYEVSNAQKRLWVLDQLKEDSIAYSMPSVFILEGEFNEKAFRNAYSYIIERHESLRTVFLIEDGNPRQRILEEPGFRIEILDLRDISDKEIKAEEIVRKDMSTSFDLSKGPLVRFSLIRLEDEKYIILFNMHHIVSDGWSMNILTRDFLEAYNSFRNNQVPDLEPLRIHYKDYSAWQNTFWGSPEIGEQRDYWLEKLSGELPVLNLTADRIRPSVQTFNGAHFGFSLPKEVQSNLNDLCRGNNVSLFMLLQALVKVLLHKYSGQHDIIIGSPIAGRVHGDLENQIGFYLNNLVLRDTVESEDSFSGFLKVSARTCSEAFDNQAYPFDRIVEDLDLKRDLSRSPLFDILVILQNNETTNLQFDGLSVLPYQANTGTEASKFDITFDFTEIPEGINCVLKYNTDIYSKDRMERMGGHLETLISSVIKNPGSRIKDLEILPAEEKNQLLNLFNDTKADYPLDGTIVDLFEEQVEKNLDSKAVVFGDLELTYRELNEKANIVAHCLIDNHGVERDDLVAVLMERSEKMIIAILGILKTGAAYVPVDPDYPGVRIEEMLRDSDSNIVVSDTNRDGYIDINQILVSGMSCNNPYCDIDSRGSCHLIYTSGTTGKPKGIVAKHENIVNFVKWGSEYYFNDGIEGNFGLFTSISYDFTSTSIFLTLLRGKTLTIFDQKTDIPLLLRKVFESCDIDSTKLTPTHISLLEDLGIENSGMGLVLTSGEELKNDHIKILKGINKDIRVVNGYGTTELPTSCIVREIGESDRKILIGKPIANTKAFVMNNDMLASIGITGELCVSGAGVARGYLNRPELTSEKFVPNPLNRDEIMYRTGDLARWLPDGNLEFLGRIDHQIKIRGFRIEPGEIESLLVG
ncbi:MAG: amino acid adenylation domain-containing protein, partial [Desulfobacteraceae bacterium]|nr:amino acid adenylation domain-containing protein [Desulfobacteraceae bacterium]